MSRIIKNLQYKRSWKCLTMLVLGSLLSISPMTEVPNIAAAAVVNQTVNINSFTIDTNPVLSNEAFQGIVAKNIGQQLSLVQLEEQADEITRYLRSQGYLVALAYIPEQDFKDGNVKVAVLPGYYDDIVINNETPIKEKAIIRELGVVAPGAVIEKKSLERAVWLLNDLANADVKTEMKAGAVTGTTTLIVNVKPKGNPVWGYAGINNGGYRYTGRYQYSAVVNQANLQHAGDLATMSLSLTGEGQTSGGLTYNTPFHRQGERIGISYARSQYTLGDAFAELGSNGVADTLSLSYQKNFVRSRDMNLYGQLRYDVKRLTDEVDSMPLFNSHKKSHNIVLGVNGDWLDNWQGGGQNTWSFEYTYGEISLEDELFKMLDKPWQHGLSGEGLATEGHFGKYNLNLTRLQQLSDRTALYLSFNQQWSNKNLDSSEKMSLGGPYAVRAYPIGEASGDEGYLATAELRYNVPTNENSKDIWQLIAFLDGGYTKTNRNPIYSGDNDRQLSGYGVGVNWSNEDNWAARLHYAWKLSSEEAVSDSDKSGRMWFQLYKFF